MVAHQEAGRTVKMRLGGGLGWSGSSYRVRGGALTAFLALLGAAACGDREELKSNRAVSAEKTAAEKADTRTPEEIGKVAFRACAVCHVVADPSTPAGKVRLPGPNLYAIVGAPAARIEGFAYSKAMREAGITWTDENLDGYLKRPATFMPGNRMAYPGERSEEKRAAIIAYLKSLTAE